MIGTKIITSVHLTETCIVARTWKERLLSWPWRPWKSVNVIIVPSKECYKLADGTVVMHPAMYAEVKLLLRQLAVAGRKDGGVT